MLIPLDASIPFMNKYLPKEVPGILREIAVLEKELAEHYGRREQDRRKVISMKGVSFQ